MQFRLADTFTDSLAKLTGDEQKAVKTAAFDLQMNPAHPGLKLHQVDRAKDKDFWSVEALEQALDYPWEKWTVFLHPAQRQLVERE